MKIAPVLFLAFGISSLTAADTRVYFGTYTRDTESEGIYLSTLDLDSGKLSAPKLVGEGDNPSFVAISPDGKRLVAVEETNDYKGESTGSLRSYDIDAATGALEELGVIQTRGGAPCHVTLDSAGRHALFANYVGGSVGAATITADGGLKETGFIQHKGSSVRPRQASPHAHSFDLDPAGRFAVAADLGMDKVMIYRFNPESGVLSANDPPFAEVKPGGGPRHFAFRPDGKFGYTNLEITSEVTAFSYDAKQGVLVPIQTISTLPEGFEGKNSTAELYAHPGGRFLYCSNRGHDSVAVFGIDPKSGKLSLVEIEKLGVKTPRGVGIDPTGRFLIACGQSDSRVRSFAINPNDGSLAATGSEIVVPKAVCAQFVQTGGEYRPLFDGKTTKGWEGDMKWFRVQDDCIVAGSQKERVPKNQFLVTEREYQDFELRFEAKLVGQGNNAGVQIWSQRIPDHHEMIGFQCDIGNMGPVSIWGALYDESRRRRFLSEVPVPTQKQSHLKDDWNRFRIRCEGNSITIWVNDCLATRYFEHEPEKDIPRNGRIGLQIHSGAPLEAWYRNIEARDL